LHICRRHCQAAAGPGESRGVNMMIFTLVTVTVNQSWHPAQPAAAAAAAAGLRDSAASASEDSESESESGLSAEPLSIGGRPAVAAAASRPGGVTVRRRSR
jgi:hypothetical protein